jgi:hypothetical protein
MRLTKEQIEARIEMYEEAANHLELSVTMSEAELEQAKVVSKELRAMLQRFYEKHYETIKKP